MLDKLEKTENTEAHRFVAGNWAWTCQGVSGKLIRDYVEISEVDANGKITYLANGKRLSFLRSDLDCFYDVYIVIGSDKKILLQRSGETPVKSEESKSEQVSEFTWE
jgi:hypothetical protein